MHAARKEQSDDARLRIVPLFPLPNVFLFPGCVMPLHIFEPRYRQMIEDLLDGPGQIVMGTVVEEHADALAGSPRIRTVAGLGEICRHERLPDGRFLVWLFGLSRVRVTEAASNRMYRRVEIEPLLETAPTKEREALLRTQLRRAILARCDEATNLPNEIPISCLVDLLLQRLGLPQREMEGLYEELDVETRAEGALAIHAQHPHTRRGRRGKASE
ncbi:MAG TPA: LON peptidase substrate-binding domain-containing protein [Planctomycetota bacterium]|jgi:Lon protease-like protein|nr:LON peptidase substrate-binding domain-containing protein [Planctomycetota bacterium]